jgi:hypothetical protein
MIKLPDFESKFEFENFFYWTCDAQRIGKLLAHFELFKMSNNVEGSIVECGVFKGASLIRFAVYRKLFSDPDKKKLIAFDTFSKFPESEIENEIEMRADFVKECGEESIADWQLMEILKYKDCDKNIELIAGDITETIPGFVTENPDLKISLLNLDVDLYEPTVTILENLYPKLQIGGVLILDDYNTFPGETKAVDDFFKDKKVTIKSFPYTETPHYIIKE